MSSSKDDLTSVDVPSSTSRDEFACMDALVVTCSRDLHLLRIMLESFCLFSRLGGTLVIVCDQCDAAAVAEMTLPTRHRIVTKQTIKGIRHDDFRNQLFIKLSADLYCQTRYIFVIDSDYLFVAPLRPSDFFENGRPRWIMRNWDNEPSLRWRQPTTDLLGFFLPFQYMDRAQYVFDRVLLKEFRTRVNLNRMFRGDNPPSEFMAYGAYCHRNHPDRYAWVVLGDDEGSLSYEVTQRAPTYAVIDPDAALIDAKGAKYCVFWSHWDLAELKMLEFLRDACHRENVPLRALGFDWSKTIYFAGKQVIEDMGARLVQLQEDCQKKERTIARLGGALEASDADRRDKDALILRLGEENATIDGDRRAKDELIERLSRDNAAIDADRRAKDELIDRLSRDNAAIDADRLAKDELIARLSASPALACEP